MYPTPPQVPPLQILITGGSGFIGRNLIRSWLPAGHTITVLTRSSVRTTHLFAGKVRCINSLDELPPNTLFDAVVNLAGAPMLGPRWSKKRRQTLLDSRVGLTQKLVRWMAQAESPPRLFLSGSAIGYYGTQTPQDEPLLSEDSPSQNIFMSNLCQAWEQAAMSAQTFTQVIRLRFGIVLGWQRALPMLLLPIKLGLGGRLGHGQQWLSWIHIDDVVAAINYLLARALAGIPTQTVYNLVAPNPIRQIEFTRVVARRYQRPTCCSIPAFLLKILLGAQADLLLEGQRVWPRNLLEDRFIFQYPTVNSVLHSYESSKRPSHP